ncbi:MAG TPA: hypothetical protein VGM62_15495 [Chthoniobacterales bacterium]|jgi:hypothetical protein
MRYITNRYQDAQLLDLGSTGRSGPFLVTQTGVSPNIPIPRTHLFVLRPDGQWVDFNAYACQGKPEVMDELVFRSVVEVMTTFSKLTGTPQVIDLPVDRAGLDIWVARHKGGDPLGAARTWAAEYIERRHQKNGG